MPPGASRASLVERTGRAATAVGAGAAVVATAHALVNLRGLRQPVADPPPVAERVSLLLPVRDEATRAGTCVKALLAQENLPDVEILVLDDSSTDGTADEVRLAAAGDPRLRLLADAPDAADRAEPPDGWLGKAWACHRLAEAATGTVLVFVDADVLLAPTAVAATVGLLRTAGLDLVSPYPRQLAGSVAERLVQPLLQWSWLTTVPLGVAERSGRASLAVANGQLLAVDTGAYRRAGGHGAARSAVLDDVELLRSIKRSGGRGTVADGTAIASCRMYDGWACLEAGYTKSLWSAFGSPGGAGVVLAGLTLAYVVPFVAALRGSRTGAVGYAAAVVGRAAVARRVGGRVWPDSLAHPVSIGALVLLTGRSLAARRAGTLTWKGRPLP
jgi:Glycosyltransferase like family 2